MNMTSTALPMIIINNHQWNPSMPPIDSPDIPPINPVNVHWFPSRTTIITHWQLCLNNFPMKSPWRHIPSFSHWHSMTPLAPNYQRPPPNICHYLLTIPKFSKTTPLHHLILEMSTAPSNVINEQCPQWLPSTLHRIPLHIHLDLQRLSYWSSNSPSNLIDVHCLPSHNRH